MKGKVINKFGPYRGPYEEVTTYKISIKGITYTWHENGERGLNAEIGDILTGLEPLGEFFDYNKSNPINTQMKLFD